MALKQITQEDTKGRWIGDLPDTPELGTEAMQAAFDSISKTVIIPAHNQLVQTLAETGAEELGVSPIEGMTAVRVQGALEELKEESNNRYTKEENDALLLEKVGTAYVDRGDSQTLTDAKAYADEKVFLTGAADMQKSVYDPWGKSTDFYAYADQGLAKKADAEKGTVTLVHSKAGTVHSLSEIPSKAGIYLAQFKATGDFREGETFQGYTAKPVGEEIALPDKAFVTGDLVSAVVDTTGKKLGFKLGGGAGVNETLPSQLSSFAGSFTPPNITLSWRNPTTAFAGVVIVAKAGSKPTKLSDGTKIYTGTGTSCTHTGVASGIDYYYRAFPYNSKKQYQTVEAGAVVIVKPMSAPKDYTYYTYYTASTTFTAPESDHYRFFVYGRSGNGCAGASSTQSYVGANGSGGGSGGGVAVHTIKLSKGQTIPLTINTAVTSLGNYCSATSGNHATNIYGATAVGTASGGNTLNASGGKGGNGGTSSYGSNPSAGTAGTINGGVGGYGGGWYSWETESGDFKDYYGGGGGGGGGGYATTKYTLTTGSEGGRGGSYGESSSHSGYGGGSYLSFTGAASRLRGGGGGGGGAGNRRQSSVPALGGAGGVGQPGIIIVERGVYS